jgi:cbb3-type cytochrome oxidase maturation protein
MSIIYVLIPIAMLFVLIAVSIFFWAVKSEQFDDLDRQSVLKPTLLTTALQLMIFQLTALQLTVLLLPMLPNKIQLVLLLHLLLTLNQSKPSD